MEIMERISDKYTKDAVRTAVGIVAILALLLLFIGNNVPSAVLNFSVFERIFAILTFAFVLGRCASTTGSFFKSRLAKIVYREELEDEEDSEFIKEAFKKKHKLKDDGSILGPDIYKYIGEKRFVKFRFEDLDNSNEFWNTMIGMQILAGIYFLLMWMFVGLYGNFILVLLVTIGSSTAAGIDASVEKHKFYRDCVAAFQRTHIAEGVTRDS